MKSMSKRIVQLGVSAIPLLTAATAFAGGTTGGGSGGGGGFMGAPEPAFLTLAAIVAGAEAGRRAIRRRRSR